jgi:hypothetical protein
MNQIPTDATVRLIMANGSLKNQDEIIAVLESYQYQQDDNDPNRWVLKEGYPAETALVFDDDEKIIDVYSDFDEYLVHLNMIVKSIGWLSCEIHARDQDTENKLFEHFNNLDIVTVKTLKPNHVEEPAAAPNEESQPIQQLRRQLAEVEQLNEELTENNQRLEAHVRQLESTVVHPSDDPRLKQVINRHLTQMFTSNMKDPTLLQELQEQGFKVDVMLV